MAQVTRQNIADLSVLVWQDDSPNDSPNDSLNGAKPDCLLVLLHGVGDEGAGLMNLAPYFASHLPSAIIIAPDAPQAFPYTDGVKSTARQWFDLQAVGLQNPDAAQATMANMAEAMGQLHGGITTAHNSLAKCLAECLKRFGIPPNRLALFGFSQGGMMALHTGLHLPQAPAAIVSVAGALLLPPPAKSPSPPVLLIHGEADEVVPVAALDIAKTTLTAQGVAVEEMRISGLGHTINDEGFEATMRFLTKHLTGDKHKIKAENKNNKQDAKKASK